MVVYHLLQFRLKGQLFLALHLVSIRGEIAARKIRQIHIAEIGER